MHLLEKREYRQQQAVYKENDKCEYLYIVWKGEVRLGSRVQMEQSLEQKLRTERGQKQKEDTQYLWLSTAAEANIFGD